MEQFHPTFVEKIAKDVCLFWLFEEILSLLVKNFSEKGLISLFIGAIAYWTKPTEQMDVARSVKTFAIWLIDLVLLYAGTSYHLIH